MNTDNTQDGAEPSPASAGSVANDQAEVLAKGIADIIRIAAEPDWIPVTERLPEDEDTCLCYAIGQSRPFIGYFAEGYWVSLDSSDYDRAGDFTGQNPTHWMPLPEPPEDGK
jgi:hypothetical protein